MKWFSNQCHRRRQSLSLLASGALPESERKEMERHLVDCPDCRSHYEQIKSVAVSLADYRASVANFEPTQAARRHWARAIRAASQSEGVERGQPKLARGGWWHELFWTCRHAWGGIAALWLVMWAVNWERPQIHEAAASATITQTFREERQMLAELLPPTAREPAEAPRRKPSPHSEKSKPWLIG